jgi:hypothetical protein
VHTMFGSFLLPSLIPSLTSSDHSWKKPDSTWSNWVLCVHTLWSSKSASGYLSLGIPTQTHHGRHINIFITAKGQPECPLQVLMMGYYVIIRHGELDIT